MKFSSKLSLVAIFCICTLLLRAESSNAYWVFFKDKCGENFKPHEYFHPSALHRRAKHNLSVSDSTDFPVKQSYINAVCSKAEYCGFASRWFNAIYVHLNKESLEDISRLPFVKRVESTGTQARLAFTDADGVKEVYKPGILPQISAMNGGHFGQNDLDGRGVRIAVFDAGFTEVNTHKSLAHLFENNLIEATQNFAHPNRDIYRAHVHGLMVLSNIAGINKKGQLLGLAPGATFLLAQTEVRREIFKEEQWWLAAAEWADKHGADIINSSLGYSYDRYFPEDMDGRKTLVSRAATMASKKGILVVCSAGNDGERKSWGIVSAPADADSVLTVGGIDNQNNYKSSFSSFGPNRRGVMKPNVCAYGTTITASKNDGYGYTDGTSFSAPLISGFAACLMQAMPNATNMEIKAIIEKSGSLYPYFDYAHGYGVPQAHLALSNENIQIEPTITLKESDRFSIVIDINRTICMHQRFANTVFRNHLYLSFEDESGVLLDYYLLEPTSNEIAWNSIPEGTKQVRIHYNGYTLEIPREQINKSNEN